MCTRVHAQHALYLTEGWGLSSISVCLSVIGLWGLPGNRPVLVSVTFIDTEKPGGSNMTTCGPVSWWSTCLAYLLHQVSGLETLLLQPPPYDGVAQQQAQGLGNEFWVECCRCRLCGCSPSGRWPVEMASPFSQERLLFWVVSLPIASPFSTLVSVLATKELHWAHPSPSVPDFFLRWGLHKSAHLSGQHVSGWGRGCDSGNPDFRLSLFLPSCNTCLLSFASGCPAQPTAIFYLQNAL